MQKKKGFTIVELLAALAILGIIMLIAVPGYKVVVEKINESTLSSKKNLAVAAAEKYSSDTGAVAISIKILIKEGRLEADNELGEYINPVTKEDMSCNIIKVNLNINGTNNGEFTNEKNCSSDIEELNLAYSNIQIIKKDSQGRTLPNGWVNTSPVTLSYVFKDEVNHLENYVTNTRWIGEEPVESATKQVSASSIKTGVYGVYVTTNQNGVTTYHSATTEVKIDLQAPVFTKEPEIKRKDEYTKGTKEVWVETSDQNGSGIYGYYYAKNLGECPTEKSQYQKSESENFSLYLEQGTYGICIIDNAGNKGEKKTVTIDKIDNDGPVISSAYVTSNDSRYNSLSTTVHLQISDLNPIYVYISTSGYETGGDWQSYSSSIGYTLSGGYDGVTRTYYIVAQDSLGNKSQTTTTYTPYTECTSTNTFFIPTTECSNKCGDGKKQGIDRTKDNYTEKICKDVDAEQACYDDSGCIPECSISVSSGTMGDNNWYKTNVGLILSVSNGGGNRVSAYGITTSSSETYNNTNSATQSAETSGQRWYGYVQNANGHTNTCTISVKVDKTPPSCTATKSNTGKTNGVTATFSCTDEGSSVVSCTSKKTELKSSQSYSIKDKAGNSGTCSVTVTSETQYRKRSCDTCTSCSSAACTSYYSCYTSGCGSEQYISSTYSCNCSWATCSDSHSYYGNSSSCCDAGGNCYKNYQVCSTCYNYSWRYLYCAHSECGCASRAADCSACGCSTWGSYGSWGTRNYCSQASINSNSCSQQSRVVYK